MVVGKGDLAMFMIATFFSVALGVKKFLDWRGVNEYKRNVENWKESVEHKLVAARELYNEIKGVGGSSRRRGGGRMRWRRNCGPCRGRLRRLRGNSSSVRQTRKAGWHNNVQFYSNNLCSWNLPLAHSYSSISHTLHTSNFFINSSLSSPRFSAPPPLLC